MKKIFLVNIIIFLTITSNNAFSISGKIDSLMNEFNLHRADKAFDNMAYIKAIHIYSNLVDKEFTNDDIYRKLAEACYKTGQANKAEKYYEQLIDNMEYTANDIYLYSQTLRYNGKYLEADRWMKRFTELDTKDSRGERQANTYNTIEGLKSIKLYDIEDISFNSKYSDFGPALNGNKLYFASDRKEDEIINYEYAWNESPYYDIYEVNMDGLVTKPKLLEGKVNSKYHDGPVCFSKDGKEMYFTRNNTYFRILSKKGKDRVNNLKIFYTKNENGELKTPIELPFDSDDYSCGHPSLSADGKILYFSSDMPGGYGESDIYMVEKVDTGWGKPINLGSEINTEGNEMFPFIHESGTLYFSSDGHKGFGGLDIYRAQKVNGKYQVENMGYPMNSEKDDFGMIMDDEQKTGYFASNRDGGKGDDDIYKFKVLNVDLNLKVRVFDKENKERITNPKIYYDETVMINNDSLASDDKYDFIAKVKKDENHSLQVKKDGYLPFKKSFNISNLKVDNNTIFYDVYLDREPEWGIYGKVFYKETKEEIPGVNIHIEDVSSSFVKNYTSDSSGQFRIQLQKNTDYKLRFEKNDVFAIRAEYSTVGRDSGWVNINKFVELAFEKIELNKKIEIPNIYYDLGKWNIRQDAAIELDKVVQFLIDNPQIQIELGSHTDARGSAKSNQWLSQKRAQAAVEFIVSKGVNGDRITAKGYGESQIKNRCKDGVQCSEKEHQENRRTEIRITGIK